MSDNNSLITTRGQVDLELRKSELSLQKLLDIESGLVYNEDNLEKIKTAAMMFKKAGSVIDETYKDIKAPHLAKCNEIDAEKRSTNAILADASLRITNKLNQISNDILKRQQQQKAENDKRAALQMVVNHNVSALATKLADADTLTKVIEVERLLNLESGNATKYGEFLQALKDKAALLRPNILSKKEAFKELKTYEKPAEDLSLEQQEDAEAGKELASMAITQSNYDLISTGSTIVIAPTEPVEFMPNIPKPRRTETRFEIKDIKLLQKHNPDFVVLEVNEKRIKNEIAFVKKQKGDYINCLPGVKIWDEKLF